MAVSIGIGSITVTTLFTWTAWYSTIILTNSSATIGLYVRCDGLASANTGAAGNLYVNAVNTIRMQNGLPASTPGQFIPGTITGVNLTAALLLAGFTDTTHLTQVSITPVSSGPGTGTITLQ